tara:strand:+ start:66 stop:302 length:237 start_codon:yes stop_codon:yes gene_type:complete
MKILVTRSTEFIRYNLLKSKRIPRNVVLKACSNNPLNIIKLLQSIEKKSLQIRPYKKTMQKVDAFKNRVKIRKLKKIN